jgi:hypothetical protein
MPTLLDEIAGRVRAAGPEFRAVVRDGKLSASLWRTEHGIPYEARRVEVWPTPGGDTLSMTLYLHHGTVFTHAAVWQAAADADYAVNEILDMLN